jgi:hypothetical protein
MGARRIRYFEGEEGNENLGLIWKLGAFAVTSGHCVQLSVDVFQRNKLLFITYFLLRHQI